MALSRNHGLTMGIHGYLQIQNIITVPSDLSSKWVSINWTTLKSYQHHFILSALLNKSITNAVSTLTNKEQSLPAQPRRHPQQPDKRQLSGPRCFGRAALTNTPGGSPTPADTPAGICWDCMPCRLDCMPLFAQTTWCFGLQYVPFCTQTFEVTNVQSPMTLMQLDEDKTSLPQTQRTTTMFMFVGNPAIPF